MGHTNGKSYCGWLRNHFAPPKKPLKAIVGWYLQGEWIHSRASERCEMGLVHPQYVCTTLRGSDSSFVHFSTKPLKVKLLAGEQKATES